MPQRGFFSKEEYVEFMPGPVFTWFSSLMQFKFVLFFEEMASIFITPFLLWFYVPKVRGHSYPSWTVRISAVAMTKAALWCTPDCL